VKKRALSLFFACLLLFPCTLRSYATIPSLSASSAVLYEPDSETFLCEKDADTKRPMASTTKIMTALVAIENSSLDECVTVPKEAVGIEGSSVYLEEGETLPMESLLYAVLLQSANDAAAAIAYAVGGSIEGFAEMMNERARALGLENTHFVNPHGLHDNEHYTTARELALIAACAMKNQTFREIASTKKKTLSFRNGTVSRVVCNHNRLLSMYGGTVGVKTGFTKKSGRCLVSAAERDGVLLIAVTLNAANDWQDHISLLDRGFAAFEKQTLIEENGYTLTLPVLKGKKSEITVSNALPLTAVLPRGEKAEIIVSLESDTFEAPIKKGTHLGEVYALYRGKRIASSPLVSCEAVKKEKTKKNLWGSLFD